jgi:hypothetical protein
MAQDPLSHVASWLTSAANASLSLNEQHGDPLLPMIAECERLYALADEIRERANTIEFAPPESIERKPLLDAQKKCADRGDFEGLYKISDKLKVGNARFNEACEASGSTALEREAEALDDEVYELRVKILETPASSLSALFYQLELARPMVDYEGLVDTIIAGVKQLRDLQAKGVEA